MATQAKPRQDAREENGHDRKQAQERILAEEREAFGPVDEQLRAVTERFSGQSQPIALTPILNAAQFYTGAWWIASANVLRAATMAASIFGRELIAPTYRR